MTARKVGLVVAIVMFAGAAVTVTHFALRAPRPSPIDPTDVGAIPNVRDLGSGLDPTGLTTAGTRIQLEDRHDPGRVSAELAWDRLDPLEARHYQADRPEATIYPRSGGRIRVRSEVGRMFWPDRTQPPESGTLEGDVHVEFFGAGRDENAGPEFVFKVPSLAYNLTLGEVQTRDAFVVEFDRGSLESHGLRLLYNDAEERVEMLDLPSGGTLTIRPRTGANTPTTAALAPETPPRPPAPTGAEPTRPRPAGGTRPETSAGSPASTPEPAPVRVESRYALRLDEDVTIVRGTLRAKGDALHLWARVIDGELPPGALPGLERLSRSGTESMPITPVEALIATAVGAQPEGSPPGDNVPPDRDEPLVVRWEGRGKMVPIDGASPELSNENHVTLRLQAEEGSQVEFWDDAREMKGSCARLNYRATERRLAMTGHEPGGVRVEGPGFGEAVVDSFTMNMSTGVARVPGAGRSRSDDQSLAWSRDAEFTFATDSAGELIGLRRAILRGDVDAQAGEASVKGSELRAWFDETLSASAGITRLEVDAPEGGLVDAFTVRDAKEEGTLSARAIAVEFEPDPQGERATPTRLRADGPVSGTRGPATLSCDALDARLGRDDRGRTIVTRAHARGQARYTNEGEATAAADEIIAEPEADRVTLLGGEGTFVESEGTTIRSPQIVLDRANRTVNALGVGSFEHQPPDADAPTLSASWSKEMRFDDLAGTLDAFGSIVAIHEPDPFTRDRLDAETISLEVTPYTPPAPEKPTPEGTPDVGRFGSAKRELIRGAAFGASYVLGTGPGARAESRRYLPGLEGGPRRLAQVVYLDSARIMVDEQEGELRTPGAGRLLVLDHRDPSPEAEGVEPPAGLPTGEGMRGTSLFTWEGSMSLGRVTRAMRMERDVRLIHESLGEVRRSELECETLTGRFAAREGSEVGRLEAADAEGAVWFKSGTRELVADAVTFDALAGRANVRAAEGNAITLFDTAGGAPLSAGELLWDLSTDTITIRRPAPVTAPR